MSGLVTLGLPPSAFDPAVLDAKERRLFELLRKLERVLVAYSGGTDSAYLAWAAKQALGQNAIAITADSLSIPRSHVADAIQFARGFGIRHELIPTYEFDNPAYSSNNPDRCFHCKDELFSRMEQIAPAFGHPHIVYGVNTDDLGDYRPGQGAAKLHNVQAPLVEAELSKAEIRELSRRAGLPTWDRPAAACLSSRIPYGTQVTPERIRQIEAGEEKLHQLGFRQCRVRYHGDLVRLEFGQDELARALNIEMAGTLATAFKELGFLYVTVDLNGYRQGSMNEVLRKAPA